MGERCRGDARGDSSAGDAHGCSCAAWCCRWRWRGRGRHGGGHPGHSSTPVRDLHSAAVRPHSNFLPRFLRLPHLVGSCLPGHQLSVWHLLPSVPYAELTVECHTVPPAVQPPALSCWMVWQRIAANSRGAFSFQHTTTDRRHLVFGLQRLDGWWALSVHIGRFCGLIHLCDQQATGINNTNVRRCRGLYYKASSFESGNP